MRDILIRVTGRADAPELENLAPLVDAGLALRRRASAARAGNQLAVSFDGTGDRERGRRFRPGVLGQRAAGHAGLARSRPRQRPARAACPRATRARRRRASTRAPRAAACRSSGRTRATTWCGACSRPGRATTMRSSMRRAATAPTACSSAARADRRRAAYEWIGRSRPPALSARDGRPRGRAGARGRALCRRLRVAGCRAAHRADRDGHAASTRSRPMPRRCARSSRLAPVRGVAVDEVTPDARFVPRQRARRSGGAAPGDPARRPPAGGGLRRLIYALSP